jgi:cytochrome P450
MVQWYNLTTFDIIGDLALGTPFEGLQNNRLHSWISMIFKAIKLGVFFRTAREYPLLAKPFIFLMAGKFRKSRLGARAHVRESVMRRIDNPELEGRGDLMDAMQGHKGGSDGLSVDELVANTNILIIAGSETTATLLSGVTYLLLKNSRCLRKVTEEVRKAFEKEEEIDFVNASSRLPYMLACLDEALRMYPPVPSGLERIIPPGPSVEIAGNELPSGVSVIRSQFAEVSCPLGFS